MTPTRRRFLASTLLGAAGSSLLPRLAFAQAAPQTDFVRPCNLCPHMKRITLEAIYDALVNEQHEVTVPEDVRIRAKKAIDAMLALPKMAKPLDFEVGRPLADVTVLDATSF